MFVDDVSAVLIKVGVSETDKSKASLPPVYAIVSVTITDDVPVVIGNIEAGVTVIMIVDISMVETAVGLCCSISVIVALVF